MKKIAYTIIVLLACYFIVTAITSCSPKYGCGTENYKKAFTK